MTRDTAKNADASGQNFFPAKKTTFWNLHEKSGLAKLPTNIDTA